MFGRPLQPQTGSGQLPDVASLGTGKPSAPTPQPRRLISTADILFQKFASRYRRLLGIKAATAVSGYSDAPIPMIPLDQFTAEDLWPDDTAFECSVIIGQVAAKGSIVQVQPPVVPGLLVCIDRIVVQRLNTAGEIDLFWAAPLSPPGSGADSIARDARAALSGSSMATLINLYGTNGGALLALPVGVVSLYSGAGTNPAILSGFTVFSIPAPATTSLMLTAQPSIVNEGITMQIEGRIIQAPPTS